MSKIYLITGAAGFVAPWMLKAIRQHDSSAIIVGTSRQEVSGFDRYYALDMRQIDRLLDMIADANPDIIINLAGLSSVGESWIRPAESVSDNAMIFTNLLEAMRLHCPKARLLAVSTSEVYGTQSQHTPFSGATLPNPQSPYAIARLTQEMMADLYSRSYGLDIVQTRAFNHTGPGQKSRFFVPQVMSKLMALQDSNDRILKTGRLDLIRDWIDVRDVCEAYWHVLSKGKNDVKYNICNNKGWCLKDVVDTMAKIVGVNPVYKQDPALLRPSDPAYIVGDNTELIELGWQPNYSLSQTLQDIYQKLNNGRVYKVA